MAHYKTESTYIWYENELCSACSFTSASFATHVSLCWFYLLPLVLCLFTTFDVYMCFFFVLLIIIIIFTGSRSRTNTKALLTFDSFANVVEFRCKNEWLVDEHNSMNTIMADGPQPSVDTHCSQNDVNKWIYWTGFAFLFCGISLLVFFFFSWFAPFILLYFIFLFFVNLLATADSGVGLLLFFWTTLVWVFSDVNLLAAGIELKFLISSTSLYMLHLLDETQSFMRIF